MQLVALKLLVVIDTIVICDLGAPTILAAPPNIYPPANYGILPTMFRYGNKSKCTGDLCHEKLHPPVLLCSLLSPMTLDDLM
jgi:hypothetical protein